MRIRLWFMKMTLLMISLLVFGAADVSFGADVPYGWAVGNSTGLSYGLYKPVAAPQHNWKPPAAVPPIPQYQNVNNNNNWKPPAIPPLPSLPQYQNINGNPSSLIFLSGTRRPGDTTLYQTVINKAAGFWSGSASKTILWPISKSHAGSNITQIQVHSNSTNAGQVSIESGGIGKSNVTIKLKSNSGPLKMRLEIFGFP